jgi:predicted peroxiredoxin
MNDNMLIVLTTGAEDRGNRATLAFAMGVSSLISGVDTTIYLTMGGTFWSRRRKNKVHIEGFAPLEEYIEQFLEAGGKLMVCSPCNEFYCSIAGEQPLLDGAELCGLTHIVDVALKSATVTL